MKVMNKIVFFCSFILLLLLICPAVTAYDELAIKNFNEGIYFYNISQYENAIASYDRAIAINPDYPEAWYNRGISLNKLGRYSEAVSSCDKAIAMYPNIADAWYNRGLALYELERYSDAKCLV